MIVAFNQRIHDGPWGGGNRFAAALRDALLARGDRVVFDLDHDDIDIILMIDPRPRNPLLTFTPGAVLRHRLLRNSRHLVVHRINECDERKGTRNINRRLKAANAVADHTVFIGSWLKSLDLWQKGGESCVILNGADPRLFFPSGSEDALVPSGKLRLVTHHWGGHRNKGLDVYRRLDDLLADPVWRDRLEFTYIGNLPSDAGFARTRVIPPLDGQALASELRSHHLYVTASINEPAGMHHIEGALSGLPLLYRNSGALPEYCAAFGEMFEGPTDVASALERLIVRYPQAKRLMSSYPWTTERMTDAYLRLFDSLCERREELAGLRSVKSKLRDLLLTQLPY